jgi:hypothetical protein
MNIDPAATVIAVAAGVSETQPYTCSPAPNISTPASSWLDWGSATSSVPRRRSVQPLGLSIAVPHRSSMRTVSGSRCSDAGSYPDRCPPWPPFTATPLGA